MNLKPGVVMLFLTLLALAVAAAGAPGVLAETIIYGNVIVTETVTWDLAGSPYIVHGYVSVASTGHLTLDPGVEVQIEPGHVFQVEDGGTLTAEGTEALPITVTAISGDFIGLRLWSGAQVSLAHCDVSHAGDGGWPAVDIQSTDVTLEHCVLHDSAAGSGSAMQLTGTGLSPTITHTTIQNNSGYAIYQSTINMTPTYLDLTLAGNGTDAVVCSGGTLDRAVTLDGQQIGGSPFISANTIAVQSGGHLVLNAGTELRIQTGCGL